MSRQRPKGRYREAAQHRQLKEQKGAHRSNWPAFTLPNALKDMAGSIRRRDWAPLSRRVRAHLQWLLLFALVFLVACGGDLAAEAAPIPSESAETALPPAAAEPVTYTISYGPEGAMIPEGIPAGLVALEVKNEDSEWHAAIIRRLHEDVSLDEFAATFSEEPFATMPMTQLLGGPDLAGGDSSLGYYSLAPGVYVLVDNWVEPWVFKSFEVSGEAPSMDLPTAGLSVTMSEYAFDMPETIPAGRTLWQFTNSGEFPHNLGLVAFEEGQTLDDLVAWLHSEEGPPPWIDVAFWNVMSPGVTSWGEIDIEPGSYIALDFMPDFASESGLNVDKGMYKQITVTE